MDNNIQTGVYRIEKQHVLIIIVTDTIHNVSHLTMCPMCGDIHIINSFEISVCKVCKSWVNINIGEDDYHNSDVVEESTFIKYRDHLESKIPKCIYDICGIFTHETNVGLPLNIEPEPEQMQI